VGVSDELWQHVQALVPKPRHVRHASIINGVRRRAQTVGDRQIFAGISMCYAPAASGRRCPSRLAAPAHPQHFQRWRGQDSLALWQAGLPSMMKWRGLLGVAKHTEHKQSATGAGSGGQQPHRSGKKRQQAQPAGDGAGVRCPYRQRGHRHDVKLLAITLDSIVVVRPKPAAVGGKLVCGQGLCGRPAVQAMQSAVIRRMCTGGEEARAAGRGSAPRRGGRTHALVVQPLPQAAGRYEKTAANFLALLQCAAALICCVCADLT